VSEPVYSKQEQEPASDEVIEVAPGVLRMQLPISMPGLGHVNTYALEDERGFALVDPGLPGPESWTALMARLETAGIPLKRVHTTIVTHSHPDHFGGADQLNEEAGAEVLTHESFRSLVAQANDDIDMDLLDADEDELVELWKQRFSSFEPTPWGTTREPPPDEAIRRWIVMGDGGNRRFRGPEPTIRVADDQVVRLARRDWFAVHTPGHTTDHLCLFDPEEGVLLAGDHVLPTITPHIAGSTEVDDPLATFFASLEKVAALEGLTCALPAHGHPFEDLAGRCSHIREHHDDRLQLLRDAGEAHVDAPVQAWMKVLFKERSWGEMAASETYAHLEHLRVIGEASARRDDEGLLRFSLADS
jgi:glyoxylase-like metal-dependent hydrolase (beta-lactamase superfamily II)